MNNYEIVSSISEGTFSSVFKIRTKDNNKELALKKIKFNKHYSLSKINELFLKITQLNHPNLIKYYDFFFDELDSTICFIMDYYKNCDLMTILNTYNQKKELMTENDIWICFFQIIRTLKELHDKNIFHKALKPSNIFLTDSGLIILSDINFFVSENDFSLLKSPGISLSYYSPEIWKEFPYAAKSDIWSLGCIIYELSTLKQAFNGDDRNTIKKKIIRGYLPPLPNEYSSNLENLIKIILNPDFNQRPSCEEILKKSFVQNKFNELSKYPLILKVIEYDKDKKTNNTIIKSSISKKFKLPKFLALNSPKELFFNESNLQSNSISLSSQRKSHPNPILNRNQMPKLNLSKINIRNSPINPDSPKKFYINTFEDENLSKEFIDNIYSPKFKKTQDKKTISVKKFEDLSKGNFLLPSIYEGKDKQKSLWINSSDNINREERKLQKTKPFIAKNISFNQIQMNRMKNNKKIGKILQNFSNNKIISLYEINKKLLLNQNYYY